MTVQTINALDAGWYNGSGHHDPSNPNYYTGDNGDFSTLRNFLIFGLPTTEPVTGARLRLYTSDVYVSPGAAGETYELKEVITPTTTLQSGGFGKTSIYNDLGDGATYGSRMYTKSDAYKFVEIELNAAAVAAINASRGKTFAMGGLLTSHDNTPGNYEAVFWGSHLNNGVQLILTSNTPPSLTGTKATLAAGTEDTVYTISATDLLKGFSDVDGDILSITGLDLTNGTLGTYNVTNGTWSFTPDANYNGSVNLRYNVIDDKGGTTAANQSFAIAAVNDTASISGDAIVALIEDSANLTLTANGNLNVSDVDAGEAKFNTTVTGADGNVGSLKITEAGDYSYTVANSDVQFLGAEKTKTDTFSVKSLDGTATKNIEVTLTGVNDDPALTGTKEPLAAGSEDTNYTIEATDLLTGISDVDGDILSVANLTATNGTLGAYNATNDTWNFNPNTNYNGSVNLTYNVIDGNGGSKAATHSFTLNAVNDAPTATNDQVSTSKGIAVTVELSDNVSDIEGLTGAKLVVTDTVGGTVPLTAIASDARQITFTPNIVGTASFKYSIIDAGGLSSNAATVTVNVGDVISTDNQSQNITGNEGNDSISAGNGKDTISGLGGADTLLGNNGVDTINAGEGDDIIWGGNGSDLLKGEGGKDKFVLAKGAGTDTISDFVAGTDKIGLAGGISFDSLSLSGSNIILTASNETLASLTGVNTSTLNADNFVTV